jgi:hypothetical protein
LVGWLVGWFSFALIGVDNGNTGFAACFLSFFFFFGTFSGRYCVTDRLTPDRELGKRKQNKTKER